MYVIEPIVIDFETWPIGRRPHAYPPEPVGVAIQWPGEENDYIAWGHSANNNAHENYATSELGRAWHSGLPLLFHHAKFDLAVAYERLGLPRLPWHRIHDTMFQAYLCDPHNRNNGLKPLAEDLLGWPPEERDALADWVWEHRETLEQTYGAKLRSMGLGGKVKGSKGRCSNPGEWIFATPGDLCGRYAIGDIARTRALHNHLLPIMLENGMGAAYDRERQVLPILMANEERGMRTDLERLERDCESYGAAFSYVEDQLRHQLGASGLNFDADADVASVLLDRGIVPVENWSETASGKMSMSKDNLLPSMFTGENGAETASALGYRNRLKTCLSMFMEPWRDQAREMSGYITTNWNQTRGAERGGTRTGRPSTDRHNFLNISKTWDGRDDEYRHPWFLDLPLLPLCRGYILPDEGDEFLHRDFSGQELRVFAHGEQGDLWEKYRQDPKLDPHAFVGAELMRVAGREIERTRVKTLNFQGLYGGGVPALQRKLRCSAMEAKQLKHFHNQALPGRVTLNEEIKRIVQTGEPIRTIGGRLYFPEPPGPDGRSKIYKLINYWIQGGAADLTKQALIDWDQARHSDARFLVTVYDEINISGVYERDMAALRDVMEAPRLGLTVPMLSDGKRGKAWGALEKCL